MYQQKTHTVLHVGVGTSLLLGSLALLIIGSVMLLHSGCDEAKEPEARRLLRKGDYVGSTSSNDAALIEATYGPLNKSALGESKQGILANIRARRQARNQCQPCQVQSSYHQSQPQQAQPSCQPCQRPRYTEPVYRVPNTPAAPSDLTPLNVPSCPGGKCLEIQPSVQPQQANAKQAILEATFGPLNKQALRGVKSAAGDGESVGPGPEVLDNESSGDGSSELDDITPPERTAEPEVSPIPWPIRGYGEFEIVPSR